MQDIPAGIQKEMQALRVLSTDGVEEQKQWARQLYYFVWCRLLDFEPITPPLYYGDLPKPPKGYKKSNNVSPLSAD